MALTKIKSSNILDGTIASDDLGAGVGAGGSVKNLIINGDMRVSQRGDYSVATAVANVTYYLDRWKIALNTVTGTLTHSTEVASGVTSESALLTATSTGTGFIAQYQPIEFPETYRGRELTISAKVKSNSANVRISVWDGVASNNSTAHTGGGAVETLTATFTVSATNTLLDPYIGYIGTATDSVSITSGDYVEIFDVQLELGSVATDFEHRSYGEELALCQRYYQFSGTSIVRNLVPYTTAVAYTDQTTFPVVMRTTPTIVTSGSRYYNGGWVTPTANTISRISTYGFNWEPAGSYTTWSPVLGEYSWTADAEL